MDTVFLHGIRTDLAIGPDPWHRPRKPQPVILNIDLVPLDSLEVAANEDDVNLTLDYGKLYKSLVQILSVRVYESIQDLFLAVEGCLPAVKTSSIEIMLPKAILLAEDGVAIVRKTLISEELRPAVHQRLEMRKIPCKCIIGVNPHERLEKQRLILQISADGLSTPLATAVLAGISLSAGNNPTYVEVVREVVERVEASSYSTVEALATAVAQIVTMNHGFENATVRIEKPSAIASITAAGVQVTRTRAFFENKDFWKVKKP